MPGKGRAIAQVIFSSIVILLLMLMIGTLDSMPIRVVFILAVIAWAVLLILWITEIRRTPTLYYYVDGEWVPVEYIEEEEKRV